MSDLSIILRNYYAERKLPTWGEIHDAADEIERLEGHLASAKAYVVKSIASYEGDPADNSFQRGFLAALEVIRDEAFSLPSA